MKYEHEIKDLLRALIGLIKEATHFLKHLEAPKPKGHLVFRNGGITPKTQPKVKL